MEDELVEAGWLAGWSRGGEAYFRGVRFERWWKWQKQNKSRTCERLRCLWSLSRGAPQAKIRFTDEI